MVNDRNESTVDAVFSNQEYRALSDYLSQACGIELGNNKQYLVKSRVTPLLKKLDINSFAELLNHLNSGSPLSAKIKAEFVDVMTTNETFWFRDRGHFNQLVDQVFPDLLRAKTGTIKVWSAACSSGQEPYSISISAEQAIMAAGKNRNIQIIGTDISETVLRDAKNAVYSELAYSRGLDLEERELFFDHTHDGYKLNSKISQRVRFQQFNLLKPFSVLGSFDVIFCRNVLIYFSEEIKRDILQRLCGALEPGGYLFLSSTESLPVGMDQFETIKGVSRYFRKRP